MLLTYEENANIPDKIHLFYNKAFETLFHKHDAMKEQYDRQRKSSLQIDDFSKIFAVFCLNTYVLEKVEFTKLELLKFATNALSFENASVKSSDFLFDLEEAVCLLQREGLSYFFVHRSFQEYFTALFLSQCPEKIRDDFIDKVCTRYWDSVLPMLFDMASAQLEPSWVVRNSDAYLAKVGNEPGKVAPVLERFPSMVGHVDESGKAFVYTLSGSEFGKFITTMRRFYPADFHYVKGIDFDVLENKFTTIPGVLDQIEKATPEKVITGKLAKVITVTLDENWMGVAEESGLKGLADFEHAAVCKVRERIGQDQSEKQQFLDTLFMKAGAEES